MYFVKHKYMLVVIYFIFFVFDVYENMLIKIMVRYNDNIEKLSPLIKIMNSSAFVLLPISSRLRINKYNVCRYTRVSVQITY